MRNCVRKTAQQQLKMWMHVGTLNIMQIERRLSCLEWAFGSQPTAVWNVHTHTVNVSTHMMIYDWCHFSYLYAYLKRAFVLHSIRKHWRTACNALSLHLVSYRLKKRKERNINIFTKWIHIQSTHLLHLKCNKSL